MAKKGKKPNPVQVIVRHAHRFGLDPAAVVAYMLEESGGRWDALGDHGTSFGPFQMHRGGALGSHSGAWAESPAGLIAGMRMMAQGGARGLKGEAAVRAIYSGFGKGTPLAVPKGIAQYGNAQRQVNSVAQTPQNTQMPAKGPVSPPNATPPLSGGLTPLNYTVPSLGPVSGPMGSVPVDAGNFGKVGDFQQVSFKRTPVTAPLVPNAPHVRKAASKKIPLQSGGDLFGPQAKPKIIGMPYEGTHGKSFNVRGGSDNWESENAVDFSVPVGTPVYALADGVIGSQFGSLGSGGRFAGLRLHLVSKVNEWYYAHLSKFAPGLQPGTRVRRGQLLGYTGSANGVPHLHLASKKGSPQ